jgi:hypothetical protein
VKQCGDAYSSAGAATPVTAVVRRTLRASCITHHMPQQTQCLVSSLARVKCRGQATHRSGHCQRRWSAEGHKRSETQRISGKPTHLITLDVIEQHNRDEHGHGEDGSGVAGIQRERLVLVLAEHLDLLHTQAAQQRHQYKP